MPHIAVPADIPGIRGLLATRPEVAGPIAALTQQLLYAPNSLTRLERELIGAHVSALNECRFCQASHTAIAVCLHGDEMWVDSIVRDPEAAAGVTEKLRALLAIAASVQRGGPSVTADHIHRARLAGATDVEIHDAVLIAAMFCMFNRYVDGLDARTPSDSAEYRERAQLVAEHGYTLGGGPDAPDGR